MDRRTFLGTLAGSVLAAPLAAEAQQATMARVGYLNLYPIPSLLEAFRQGLQDHGWREGQNLVLEARAADGREARIPDIAAEFIRLRVDVVLFTATSVRRGRSAVGTIPIVFAIADDPVSAGFVQSFARPGGRLTGITSLNVELDAKRLQILKSALPSASRVALLATSRDPALRDRIAAVERAARSLGVQIQIIEVSGPGELAAAFDTSFRGRAGSVMVLGSGHLFPQQERMAELARPARMPVISAWREFADAGGLMSYGTNVPAMFRRAAGYVDRILKGANAADLPVEQANTFELVINLKTAKALGLTIPPSLLQRADQVIE